MLASLRVLFADDQTVLRDGFLDTAPADVIVVDLSLPESSAAAVAAQLRGHAAGSRTVAVAAAAAAVGPLREAGVAGVVLRRTAAVELVKAVRAVAAGGTYLDSALADDPPAAADPAVELSDRESEVLKLIAEGYANKEIAARLTLSIKTVETYKTRSLEKLGLRSRVDIVRYAAQRGWLADLG